jgi:hypothetical protein
MKKKSEIPVHAPEKMAARSVGPSATAECQMLLLLPLRLVGRITHE